MPRRFIMDPFEEMRRMFSSFFEETPFPRGIDTDMRRPLADIWETKDAYHASIEIPGVNKEDITINVVENGLEIKAVRREKAEEHKKGFYRIERSYSGFYKYIALPENAELEKAEAHYKNGVLEITVPKSEEKEASKKHIEIK